MFLNINLIVNMDKNRALDIVEGFMRDNNLLYHEIADTAIIDLSLLTKRQYKDLLKAVETTK